MNHRITRILCASAVIAGLALPVGASALSLGGLFGSPVDAQLAAQVPQDKRGAINAADYELACAKLDVELAKLKEELADRQDDLANAGTKLAKARQRAAELTLDIAKMDAIIASNLGKPEENAKILSDLKSDQAKNAADMADFKAKVEQNTLFVRDWTQRVAAKEKTVSEFKTRRGGGAAAAAAKNPAPRPTDPPKPADDPVDIINKSPDVAPSQEAATPEADLKN
jgi:hypothetical protein